MWKTDSPAFNKNLYIFLDDEEIRNVLIERDISSPEWKEGALLSLQRLDEILPEWIENIINLSIDRISSLQQYKLKIYAAYYDIDTTILGPSSNLNLTQYIRLVYIWKKNIPYNQNKMFVDRINDIKVWRCTMLACGMEPVMIIVSTYQELRTAFSMRNLIVPGKSNIPELTARFNRLNNPNCDILLLHKLYGEPIYNVNSVFSRLNILRYDEHSLEDLITNIERCNPVSVLSQIGMVMPISTMNHSQYLRNNILEYKSVFDRNPRLRTYHPSQLYAISSIERTQFFNSLTDVELINLVGIKVPYKSRKELIFNMNKVFHSQCFFISVKRNVEYSVNKETFQYSDITDPSLLIICYGTYQRHYSYELIDLIMSFRTTSYGVTAFRRPENPLNVWDKNAISDLHYLLKMSSDASSDVSSDVSKDTSNRENINILSDHIDSILTMIIEYRREDEDNLLAFSKMTNEEQLIIHELLLYLFYVGMYSRRWKGPGHPYPMKLIETLGDWSPEQNVTDCTNKIGEILNSKETSNAVREFFNSLNVYTHHTKLTRMNFKLLELITSVIKGIYCIRTGSAQFVGTSCHYMKILFNQEFPDFDRFELEIIS